MENDTKKNMSVENNVDSGASKRIRKMRIIFEDGQTINDGCYKDIYDKLGGESRALLAILSKKVNVEYYE